VKWQTRLLPWFIAMPSILIIVFIYLATSQLTKFNNELNAARDSVLIGRVIPLPSNSATPPALRNDLKYLKWVTLAALEQESYYRRYHQGGMLLMSRIFTQYLGFFTGMILAIVGSVFIIGKFTEGTTKLEGSITDQAKLNLISSSPGIIFAVLGTVLMVSAILKHNDITVADSPLYLNSNSILSLDVINVPNQKIDTANFNSLNTINSEFDKDFSDKVKNNKKK
jgi:hypothetical protein